MDTSPRDRITVDLQGLKAALMARAEAEGLAPSQLVRQLLAASLTDAGRPERDAALRMQQPRTRRLCLRLRPEEVRAVLACAERAGQRPGRWLARVALGGPVGATAEQLDAHRAALVQVQAELAALHRSLRRCEPMPGAGRSADAEALLKSLREVRSLMAAVASDLTTRESADAAIGAPTRGRAHARSAS